MHECSCLLIEFSNVSEARSIRNTLPVWQFGYPFRPLPVPFDPSFLAPVTSTSKLITDIMPVLVIWEDCPMLGFSFQQFNSPFKADSAKWNN